MFLSRDELRDFSGCKQRGKVSIWLTANGYKFEVADDGWPRVMRAAVEEKLMSSRSKRTIGKTQPDFSAYVTSPKAA